MVQRLRIEWILVTGLAISFAIAPSCALFPGFMGTSPQGGPENAGFQRTASVSSNPVPLPVEIVSDISVIASGYNNPQDGVWKPVYPEVERKPATPEAAPIAGTAAPLDATETKPESVIATETTGQATDAAANAVSAEEVGSREPKRGGKRVDYKVRSGDTLMKISFEKFGNIYRWREIYNSNKEKIPNFNRLVAGTILVIEGVEYVVITRNGTPYLIRRGDTLGKISNMAYGVTTKWRSIWKNNPELIRDPNKIYAGFTLYYVPERNESPKRVIKQISTSLPEKPKEVSKAPASIETIGNGSSADSPAATGALIGTDPMAPTTPSPASTQDNSWVPAQ